MRALHKIKTTVEEQKRRSNYEQQVKAVPKYKYCENDVMLFLN